MPPMQIKLKRIYEAASSDDGVRILVDRLWPRGISKERAKIDRWLREAAPSNDLRKRFNHKPEHWAEFKRRYFAELSEKDEVLRFVLDAASRSRVTLLFAAKNAELNNAVVLKEHLFDRRTEARQSRVST